ncbi:MAG: hypothetical protein AAB569_01505, partial [Patescibacteria group bacterium]
KVNVDQTDGSSNVYLSQSYSPGWIAISNGKILQHVLVNNWANGWVLDDRSSMIDVRNNNLGSKIYDLKSILIIFWPQYLEFLGFALLAIAFLVIIKMK